jgi:carbamoyltransferase
VTREANPRYHALISEFARQTGVPVVLNTSFNDNEPIVCRPEEALDCFVRTQMDALVLGDILITRP